ncbi:hypothetical protein [Castellaniella sp.]|uniref:hypothetical protein n=1 Tax=Castellaniella sp. TaxID=1955812 RepID=UPI003C73A183
MKLFASFWKKQDRDESREGLLNSALDIALDFDNCLSPIQGRLKDLRPSLSDQELDELNQTCLDMVLFGQHLALRLSSGEESSSMHDRFNALLTEQYPWIAPENLERAYRYCIYYATKTARIR